MDPLRPARSVSRPSTSSPTTVNAATLAPPASSPDLRRVFQSAWNDVQPLADELTTWAIVEQRGDRWFACSREFDTCSSASSPAFALEQMLSWLRDAADHDELAPRRGGAEMRTRAALALSAAAPRLADRFGMFALEVLVQIPPASFFEERESEAYDELAAEDVALAEAMFPLAGEVSVDR